MMSVGLLISLIVLFIIAMLGTFYAFRQQDKTVEKYEEEGVTVEEELRRSNEYEKTSLNLKSGLSLQIWIYVITIGLCLIAFAIYLF